MKIQKVSCLTLLASLPGFAGSILSLPHRSEVLSNGLRVYMVKYPSPGAVSYQIPVRVGSRNEVEEGKTGFAHFFEHLMFRGTKTMNSQQFSDLYSKLGCENNAWTWFDLTNYHGQVATPSLPKILSAEADRFANLYFDEKALKDEAGAIVGEYNKTVANPEFFLEEELLKTAFKIHPYRHTTMGFKEDILKYTERYTDVWPFFKRYYRPENVSLVLVGDFDFNSTLAHIRKTFGPWKVPEMPPVEIPTEPPQTEPRSAKVTFKSPTQSRLTISYRIPPFSTKSVESMTLAVLAEMAFSTTSQFQKTYRFKRKWVDSVRASADERIDPSLWTISLRLSQEGEAHKDDLFQAVDREIRNLRERLAPKDRVEATKARFKNTALVSWFGSPEALASRIAWYASLEGDLTSLDRIFDQVALVSSESIKSFAQKYFNPQQKILVSLEGSSTP